MKNRNAALTRLFKPAHFSEGGDIMEDLKMKIQEIKGRQEAIEGYL